VRDRGREQIERITLAVFSLYLAVFASYMVFVRYTGLMNGSLLDKALALGYAVSSLPLPMFAVAKSLMPRGWRYAVDVRNSFVVYLCGHVSGKLDTITYNKVHIYVSCSLWLGPLSRVSGTVHLLFP